MTTRKRNEFLDIVESDDEENDRGYDSEVEEQSKGRSVKRRRTQSRAEENMTGIGDEEESEESEAEGSVDEAEMSKGGRKKRVTRGGEKEQSEEAEDRLDNEEEGEEERDGAEDKDEDDYGDQYLDATMETATKSMRTGKGKPLDKTKEGKKKNKTGVVYLSSLPPYLKPFALKSLLETRGFSPITKVFLTPSVRAPSAPRRRSNKRKTYTDGWVEFASKKTAKVCAETLNASIVGGRKGGWYHDDVWNMKYLRGFKWADLMEQVQREKSEREAKRRIEDMRARKEEKVFLQGYETGKMLDGMQKKNEEKRKRRKVEGRDGEEEEQIKVRRLFKQSETKVSRDKIAHNGDLEEDTKRVLGKIF